MSQKIELTEETKITLDYADILSIFSSTKMIKNYNVGPMDRFAVEIEKLLENKLVNSAK
jgi:hypothetical protein